MYFQRFNNIMIVTVFNFRFKSKKKKSVLKIYNAEIIIEI